MRRPIAVLGTLLFFAVPLTVAFLVPYWISGWHFRHNGIVWLPLRVLGGLLVVVALAVLVDAFARFALQGLGTPAPVLPPRRLVVSGLYRYVRNPMYVAVVSIIVGQGLLFANPRVVAYGALVWLLFHLFVLAYEEPTLRASFGPDYERFCATVPRWIPRLADRRHAEKTG